MEEEAIQSSRSRASSAAPAALKKIESTSARMEEGVALERTRKIRGKVSSIIDDEKLSGVEVSVNETSLKTVTDSDGTYTIEIPEDRDALLIYSYPGFESKEVQVVDREIIDVNIEPDPAFVSEIVALGYQDAGEKINTSNSYIPPRPVGGSLKFNEYVQENIRYPFLAIDEKIGGAVKLKITVGIYGQISNVEVLKSLGEGFDEEAVRLIVEGPEWEAAVEGDTAVARDVEIKIRFWPPE